MIYIWTYKLILLVRTQKIIFLFLFLMSSVRLYSSDLSIKSIQIDLKKGFDYLKNNPDSSSYFLNKALTHSKKVKIDSLIARSIFYLGRLSYERGDYFVSDSLYQQVEKYLNKSNLKFSARLVFSKGSLQMKLGNYQKAVELFVNAKKIFKNSGDTLSYDEVDMSIAIMYMEKGELPKAKKIIARLISEYSNVENDPLDISSTYGFIHYQEGNLDSAVYYFTNSLNSQIKSKNLDGVAVSYNNIGHALLKQQKFEEAFHSFEKSLEVYLSINSKHGEAFVRNSIGQSLYSLGRIDEAIQQLTQSYVLSKKLGLKSFVSQSTLRLSKIYAEINDYNTAYEMLKIHKAYNDSTINESSEKSIQELQTKFDFDKQEGEMALLREKQKADEADKEKSRSIFNLMLVVVLLVVLGFIVTAVAYKNNRKKNHLLEIKNLEIAQQNKEIKDSINYAKRIQKAILPPENLVKSVFPESFVFYLPKDIVSGDFYWMETIVDKSNSKKNVLLAAADCTGHGVPGAMVSVVCHNALNRSVREFGLTDPGKILDKTREIVIQEFEKSETDVKDGMDISIINLEISEEKKLKVSWAGANNPLWIVRRDEIKNEWSLIEIKPDKQPIGKFIHVEPFTTQRFSLLSGDVIYLFTDGLADQFGGLKGKKLKIAGLKHVIKSIQHLSMNEQLENIQKSFHDWKGNIEQLDDVCVIGLRI
jgi:serine phosphatase RsbU (regulator of sigma subunit)